MPHHEKTLTNVVGAQNTTNTSTTPHLCRANPRISRVYVHLGIGVRLSPSSIFSLTMDAITRRRRG